YEHFQSEFSYSAATWEVYRVNAFVVTLLGTLVFPREDKNIDTRLIYIMYTLAKGRDVGGNTIVPKILAEITKALSKCVQGKRFFEECYFLLQLWAVKHFYKRGNLIDTIDGVGKNSHPPNKNL
ncbi:MAG: hypothetical protein Q8887_02685, partial [Candidatus Phytoplasma australasiaticum]|nr:hypothetical protein [Candidatus Phytoplasma australasiaticum]